MSEQLIENFINGRCWSDIDSREVSLFVNQGEEHVRKMVDIAVSDRKDISWRTAWLLGRSMNKSNNPVQRFYLKIIKGIRGKDSGHQRELIKLVIDKNLSNEEEGRLFETCIEIWKDIRKKPGTRSYAFQFIYKAVNNHQELQDELQGLFESQYLETLSPAIRKTILMKLKSADFNVVN